MSITVEATYEGGFLKPLTPLPLKEHEKVRVTIDEEAEWRASRVQATYGIMGWKGDSETIQRLALDPEFDKRESP
jgi:predicted DNA-binding antitoxin AbrB/MazE fold protein